MHPLPPLCVSPSPLQYLTVWARNTSGILVCALQQPTPEMASLFDDVLLMAEGVELYHGPVARLDEYLCSLGGCVCCEGPGSAIFICVCPPV